MVITLFLVTSGVVLTLVPSLSNFMPSLMPLNTTVFKAATSWGARCSGPESHMRLQSHWLGNNDLEHYYDTYYNNCLII